MNFHGKVRVAFVAVNSILIMMGYFVMAGEDSSLMTDQDWVTHGVGVYLWPLSSLFMMGLVVVAVYVMRGAWLLWMWLYQRISQA